MKKIMSAFISISVFLGSNVYSQDNNLDIYQSKSKNIIDSYNKNDTKGFSSSFNKDLLNVLPESKINEVINSLKLELGEIKNIGEPKLVSESTIMQLLTFEKGKLNLILSFDKENKISGILFKEQSLEIKYPEITKSTSIDDIVKPYIEQKENVGLAVGIINSDGKIGEYYYGKTARNKVKPDSNTLFEIGSITKVFTTTALAKLVVDKKVNLSDELNKFTNSPDYQGKKIQLVNLATHTSGLPRLPMEFMASKADPLNPYSEFTSQQMYSSLANYKLTRAPGINYEYSNFAMGILGDVLAAEEKTDYENLIKNIIIEPLDMKNTGIKLSRTQIKNMSTGHDTSGRPVLMWDFASMGAAGAIKSNVPDMLKFLRANINLDNSLLKDAMKLAQTSVFKENNIELGLGWHINKFENDNLIWHNGGTGGYRSFLGFLKNNKTGVIVLSNSANDVDQIGSLIIKKLNLDK